MFLSSREFGFIFVRVLALGKITVVQNCMHNSTLHLCCCVCTEASVDDLQDQRQPGGLKDEDDEFSFMGLSAGLLSSSAPQLQGDWREVKRKMRTPKKSEEKVGSLVLYNYGLLCGGIFAICTDLFEVQCQNLHELL